MTIETLELKPEQQAIIEKANDISTQLSTFKIANQPDYERAGEYLKSVKMAYKQVEDLRLSMTRPLDDTKKRIMDFFKKPLDILVAAESVLKRGILAYQQEQERIRQEQERKLQAEAEKKRQEALAKAEKAREEGKDAKAEKYEDKANGIIAPTLAPTVEKVSGVTTKKIWKFEVINEALLPREYLAPNLIYIGKVVRAMGENVKIPGVRIYPEETIAVGGRAC